MYLMKKVEKMSASGLISLVNISAYSCVLSCVVSSFVCVFFVFSLFARNKDACKAALNIDSYCHRRPVVRPARPASVAWP